MQCIAIPTFHWSREQQVNASDQYDALKMIWSRAAGPFFYSNSSHPLLSNEGLQYHRRSSLISFYTHCFENIGNGEMESKHGWIRGFNGICGVECNLFILGKKERVPGCEIPECLHSIRVLRPILQVAASETTVRSRLLRTAIFSSAIRNDPKSKWRPRSTMNLFLG